MSHVLFTDTILSLEWCQTHLLCLGYNVKLIRCCPGHDGWTLVMFALDFGWGRKTQVRMCGGWFAASMRNIRRYVEELHGQRLTLAQRGKMDIFQNKMMIMVQSASLVCLTTYFFVCIVNLHIILCIYKKKLNTTQHSTFLVASRKSD